MSDTIPLSEKLDTLMGQYPEITSWGPCGECRPAGMFIHLRGGKLVHGLGTTLDEAAEQATRKAMALINEMRGET